MQLIKGSLGPEGSTGPPGDPVSSLLAFLGNMHDIIYTFVFRDLPESLVQEDLLDLLEKLYATYLISGECTEGLVSILYSRAPLDQMVLQALQVHQETL